MKLNPRKDWTELKTKIKEAHPNVTDQDLAYVKGQEDELIDRLVEKTEMSRKELIAWINNL